MADDKPPAGSGMRRTPNLAGLDEFASNAKLVAESQPSLKEEDKVTPKVRRTPAPKKERPAPVKRTPAEPTSFYMTATDKERLRSLVNAMNGMSSSTKISSSMILRALILMGGKMKPETIFEAVKKVVF